MDYFLNLSYNITKIESCLNINSINEYCQKSFNASTPSLFYSLILCFAMISIAVYQRIRDNEPAFPKHIYNSRDAFLWIAILTNMAYLFIIWILN